MFAYCRNNPINRIDSDGYRDEPGCGGGGGELLGSADLELGIIEEEEEQLLLRNIISSEMDEQLALEAQEMRIAEDRASDPVKELEKTSNLNTTHRITMGKNKFNKFVETIKNEGIKEPIKYVENNNKKYVVDRHHRLQAAKRLGIEDVPVEEVDLPYAGYKSIDDLLWSD